MTRLTRWRLPAVLLLVSTLGGPHEQLQAQASPEAGEEAPATFVSSEELPADAAVSFPVDI